MDRCERVQVTGPLAEVAAGFQRSLVEQGYSLYSANAHLLLMAHVSRWLACRVLDGVDLTEARAQEFLRARRAEGYAHPVSMRGMRPSLEYLRAAGVASMPARLDVASPVDVLIERYRIYLVEERGLSASSTVRHYCTVARAFLAHRSIMAEVDLMGLTTADVTDFVLWQSRRCALGYAKAITTRLRCLLRFLHVEGLIPN